MLEIRGKLFRKFTFEQKTLIYESTTDLHNFGRTS